jgi:general secretion pathway protein J
MKPQMKRDTGLTLIELVAAMAVFALVAIMGLQSLTGMLRNRDRLAQIDNDTSALTIGLARLRHDLSAAMPMLFYPPDRQPPQSALFENGVGAQFSLTIGGQQALDGSHRLHRAQWRFDPDSNQLYRSVWTALTPANTTAFQPEVLIMTSIEGFDLRSYWPDAGWNDGVQNPNAGDQIIGDGDTNGSAPEVYSDSLPLGLEITLRTQNHGPITIIEAFK